VETIEDKGAGANDGDRTLELERTSATLSDEEKLPVLVKQVFHIDKSTFEYVKEDQETFNLSMKANCGTMVKVTRLLVFVGCPQSGIIEVFMRRSMNVIYVLGKYEETGFREDVSIIQHENGKQVLLFLSIPGKDVQSDVKIAVLEVIVDTMMED